MVPIYLGSLRSKLASTTAEVQNANETHAQTTIFINSDSFLTGNKIQEHDIYTYIFSCRVP